MRTGRLMRHGSITAAYPTADAAYAAYADHLNRGRVAAYDALGLTIVMRERSGAQFRAWQMRVRHRPYPFLIPERTGG